MDQRGNKLDWSININHILFSRDQLSGLLEALVQNLAEALSIPKLCIHIESEYSNCQPQNPKPNLCDNRIQLPIYHAEEKIGQIGIPYYPLQKNDSMDQTEIILKTVSCLLENAITLQKNSNRVGSIKPERVAIKAKSKRLIGNSKPMQRVYQGITQVAESDTSVLLLGESGVGKELVADAIHSNSGRKNKPFIKVNCAAIPESLLESELFGHEKGAFTGALHQKKGRFELANQGTIFLDEVGDCSLPTQIKLLRVIQERQFERLGSATPLHTNVRIIAATNRPLEDLIKVGRFREDLYYRLNVFPIHIPPLRERKTDIPLLANCFIEKFNSEMKKKVKRISTPAIDLLMSYHWPGNVRELENCIERAMLLSKGGVIHGHHLPPTLQSAESSQTKYRGSLKIALTTLEKELLIDALKTTGGNMSQAGREIGLSERMMRSRVSKYKIDVSRFRNRRDIEA